MKNDFLLKIIMDVINSINNFSWVFFVMYLPHLLAPNNLDGNQGLPKHSFHVSNLEHMIYSEFELNKCSKRYIQGYDLSFISCKNTFKYYVTRKSFDFKRIAWELE